MSDKLEKYLSKGKSGRKDDTITVPADGEEWSVRRLTTIEVRRAYELAYEENGDPKDSYNEIDVMIVKATEHEFDWNNKDLLLAFNCTSKYELPPRILDNPADYSELSKAVRNFQETKDELMKEAKNSSSKTEKQAG
ncbi:MULTISPECIES: hypothetical protein [Paenibacillus]|uniref:Phage tail protein n=2 Tax=Paenibacillus TaxID=44249 RepID=A0AB36JA73_9BACL|nr:hypothetical protein [Paenibacillus odorifer]MEC0131538.1 hypothetical protein [Paenibacillus odorifer]MEC0220309.1 hypothetical protein [Paenibacillus odorifer]OME11421.1 hypothetical protein BSK47_29010 [Paenibacillus odorifer]